MAFAFTAPIPGRAFNWSTVAVFRSSKAVAETAVLVSLATAKCGTAITDTPSVRATISQLQFFIIHFLPCRPIQHELRVSTSIAIVVVAPTTDVGTPNTYAWYLLSNWTFVSLLQPMVMQVEKVAYPCRGPFRFCLFIFPERQVELLALIYALICIVPFTLRPRPRNVWSQYTWSVAPGLRSSITDLVSLSVGILPRSPCYLRPT